jgi:anti-sigma regulatory factor (Ser/Thr protein kinase)
MRYYSGMHTDEIILGYLKKHGNATGKDLRLEAGISRQLLHVHLKRLIEMERIAKTGATRSAIYFPVGRVKAAGMPARFRKRYRLSGLEEHVVFNELEARLNARSQAFTSAFRIFQYAFSEMLNNAIEHSRSAECLVEAELGPFDLFFRVKDQGIGIWHSLREKFGIEDEYSALGELTKGKKTTQPEKHTGEGVFFTSKAGDSVSFRSHRLALLFDNRKKDIFVREGRPLRGTEVLFRISRKTHRNLEEIFRCYSPEAYDYRFEKTRVHVGLFQRDYVSRSEARRLLSGLEKFREIILDFQGVGQLGQGFMDEIFRVFRNSHPEIQVKTENLSGALTAAFKHVFDNRQ